MESYLKDNFFIETMVIHPKYLNSSLCKNLGVMINNIYPETYQNKGYIFNISVDSVLRNRVSLYGQIIFEVKFASNLYTPAIGHVFKGKVYKSREHQWIKIGPLLIYLTSKSEQDEVAVEITSVKSDNTTCYGTPCPSIIGAKGIPSPVSGEDLAFTRRGEGYQGHGRNCRRDD